MALNERYAQLRADIHLLVSQQFPFYRPLQASAGANSLGLPDPKGYLEDALALESDLERVSAANPDKFASMVREGRFRALGKTLPISECSAFIADKLFPDDGYPETVEQRDKCANDYALILSSAISCGALSIFNPHTKAQFDKTRLLPAHFRDGLIPVNRLADCLRPQDMKYVDCFPSRVPMPVKISECPAPITPLRGASLAKPVSTVVPAPTPVPAMEPKRSDANPAVKKGARLFPMGGDSLTPIIWEVCYDMRDAGESIKPKFVMEKLKNLADLGRRPLVGVVAGGVKFERETGEEAEVNNDALRKRIKAWTESGG